MNLTQKQTQRISKYLRDIDLQLGSLSDSAREAARARLRSRLQSELSQFRDTNPEDHEIDAILSSCGTPARVAAELLGKYGGLDSLVLSTDRRLLGVCAGISRRLGADVRWIRLMAFVLGIFTGPLALLVYLGFYWYLYISTEDAAVPQIERRRLLRMILGTLGGVVALYAGSSLLDVLIVTAYTRYSGYSAGSLNHWRWLNDYGLDMFFWAVALLLPIAALSGLPLADEWDATGKKLTQAGIALYAAAICFGLAVILVGVIVNIVKGITV